MCNLNTHFVWLKTLTKLVHIPIFKINPNIIFYHVSFEILPKHNGYVSRIKVSIFSYDYAQRSSCKNNNIFTLAVNENSERESLYLLYLYLSGSAFLVSFTTPNK